jgi:tetratricopeptide (TPR) repeat protein
MAAAALQQQPPQTAAAARTAIPGTALGAGPARAPGVGVGDSHTDALYALVERRQYAEALQALAARPGVVAGSRAALSLAAFCCYQLRDFAGAAQAYGELVAAHADAADEALYTLYHVQSLYKAGQYADAQRACQRVDAAASGAGVAERLRQLSAAIAYECDDLPTARALLPPLPLPHATTAQPHALLGRVGGPVAVPRVPSPGGSQLLLCAHACLAYKEGHFDNSRALFEAAAAECAPAFRVRGGEQPPAVVVMGAECGRRGLALCLPASSLLPFPPHHDVHAQADLAYNIALCHYCTKAYGPALRAIAAIVDHAASAHPQLVGGLQAGGQSQLASGHLDGGGEPSLHSVAQDPALPQSAVVEALNLKAAIQFELRDEAAAR